MSRKKNVLRTWQVEGATTAIQAFRAADPALGGGAYLQWDPGMGKTLGTLAIARFQKFNRIVVLCPVVAKGVWRREVAKWWPEAQCIEVEECNGQTGPTLVLVSYDKLIDRIPADPKKMRGTAGRQRIAVLADWKPDLLVLDEAQMVKSAKTQRTRAVTRLSMACTYKLLLSGTPAHSPLDWWAQYRIIAPRHPMWAQSFQRYRDEVLVLTGPNGNWPKKGPDGKPMMKPGAQNRILEAMAPFTHHADASLVNLPEPIEQIIPVELSKVEMKHYAEMAKFFRTELDPDTEAQATIALTKLLRFAQISAGFVTDQFGAVRDLGTSKLDALLELLDERADEKVVVSCRFAHDIERIHRALEARQVDVRVISGATPEKARTAAEDWFQKTPGGKVLIIQQRAGGVAITLSEAKCLIFFTLDWSIPAWRQTWGRVWRIGQTGNVQIIYLVGNGTFDEEQLLGIKRGATLVDMARGVLNQIRRVQNGDARAA